MTIETAFAMISLLQKAIEAALVAGKKELSAEDMAAIKARQAAADAEFDDAQAKLDAAD